MVIPKVRSPKHWGCRKTVNVTIDNTVVFVPVLSLGLTVVSDGAPY